MSQPVYAHEIVFRVVGPPYRAAQSRSPHSGATMERFVVIPGILVPALAGAAERIELQESKQVERIMDLGKRVHSP